jgi:hypothetical protein
VKRKSRALASLGLLSLFALTEPARAETTIIKPADGWEVYTSGRVGAFVELLDGQGVPPNGFDTSGPTAGHIGYGVIANVFAGGVAYATPSFYGLQLWVGYYDPATVVGQIYQRTKLGRPEAEAIFDANFADMAGLLLAPSAL